ncbi:hypothetical protein BJY52DRAFT_1226459 [Lactarius psammicola]|nr:hypothetical protein BJY52DRAFT_1226459 [Lactarius psammicola]
MKRSIEHKPKQNIYLMGNRDARKLASEVQLVEVFQVDTSGQEEVVHIILHEKKDSVEVMYILPSERQETYHVMVLAPESYHLKVNKIWDGQHAVAVCARIRTDFKSENTWKFGGVIQRNNGNTAFNRKDAPSKRNNAIAPRQGNRRRRPHGIETHDTMNRSVNEEEKQIRETENLSVNVVGCIRSQEYHIWLENSVQLHQKKWKWTCGEDIEERHGMKGKQFQDVLLPWYSAVEGRKKCGNILATNPFLCARNRGHKQRQRTRADHKMRNQGEIDARDYCAEQRMNTWKQSVSQSHTKKQHKPHKQEQRMEQPTKGGETKGTTNRGLNRSITEQGG